MMKPNFFFSNLIKFSIVFFFFNRNKKLCDDMTTRLPFSANVKFLLMIVKFVEFFFNFFY